MSSKSLHLFPCPECLHALIEYRIVYIPISGKTVVVFLVVIKWGGGKYPVTVVSVENNNISA